MSFVSRSVMETVAIAGNLESGADANTNRMGEHSRWRNMTCLCCCGPKSDYCNYLYNISIDGMMGNVCVK